MLTSPTLDSVAQSIRAAGGRAFEFVVAKILNSFLVEEGIVITRANQKALRVLIGNPNNVQRMMDFTRVPVKRKCTQTQIEDYPDLDLFALVPPAEGSNLWRLLAIINCKVSFHARHTEATFWGLLVRLSSNIKFVVVTEDRDIYRQKQPRSELGTSCDSATATRRLLEAFSDRIYLVNRYRNEGDPRLTSAIETKRLLIREGRSDEIIFDSIDTPRHTQYCHSVRPLDDLIEDLKHWRREIPAL